jgi:hypothetical protein
MPVEPLPRRQDLRAPPARALLGALVAQVLGIELAQPVPCEGWPGAVAQQRLVRTMKGAWKTWRPDSAVLGLSRQHEAQLWWPARNRHR